MIFVSILIFIIVAFDFVRDSSKILREYPKLKQFYGTKGAVLDMTLDIIFWLMELTVLISVLVWWF
ncbi:MAG: hypothetical protein ACOCZ5_01835 [bacterium]